MPLSRERRPAASTTTRGRLERDDARVAGIEPNQTATLDAADFMLVAVKSLPWRLEMLLVTELAFRSTTPGSEPGSHWSNH